MNEEFLTFAARQLRHALLHHLDYPIIDALAPLFDRLNPCLIRTFSLLLHLILFDKLGDRIFPIFC